MPHSTYLFIGHQLPTSKGLLWNQGNEWLRLVKEHQNQERIYFGFKRSGHMHIY